MNQKTRPYEFIDHTADVTLVVYGDSLAELFCNAARGMIEYLFGAKVFALKSDTQEELRVEAKDAEALLVDWLSELLFRTSAQYRAFIEFEILECAANKIVARLGSVQAEAQEDIKAVTFHRLVIEKSGGRFQTKVTFDI